MQRKDRLFSYVAKMFKEKMPLSYHQICTCKCGFEQEFRQVLEMEHGRITHMKEHETKYNELVQRRLKISRHIYQSLN